MLICGFNGSTVEDDEKQQQNHMSIINKNKYQNIYTDQNCSSLCLKIFICFQLLAKLKLKPGGHKRADKRRSLALGGSVGSFVVHHLGLGRGQLVVLLDWGRGKHAFWFWPLRLILLFTC